MAEERDKPSPLIPPQRPERIEKKVDEGHRLQEPDPWPEPPPPPPEKGGQQDEQ